MIDVMPTSRSAIFANPSRKMSPSLIWAILIAVALHLLLAFYLLMQTFSIPLPTQPITEQGPIVVSIDPPVKTTHPKPVVVKVPVHATTTVPDHVDTTTIIPTKGPAIDTDKGPLILPDGDDQVITDPGTDTGPVFVQARWAQFPDSNTLTDYYPPVALDNDKTGSAEVECTILDAAGRVSCAVVSETPRNYGFGAATVKMVEAKGRVDTNQGTSSPARSCARQ